MKSLTALPQWKSSTTTKSGTTLGAHLIASAPLSTQKAFLETLTEAELAALPYLFEFWALPHQCPPLGDWRTWVILGGRGAGKTRAGAEWVRSLAEGPSPLAPGVGRRIALVGETMDQAREVMVFGESGLLAISPEKTRPHWHSGRRMLEWANGATAQVLSAHDPDALRGRQFDYLWADELGCAAIDKGTNQPNKFLDPKSSESQLPHYSNGRRDDFMQMQYLRAIYRHYADPAHNPVSDIYGKAMVDMRHAHVWAWDARPFPYFPGNQTLWRDGDNYTRGHWLNGRSTNRTLASVVAEICRRSGVSAYDVSRLYGLVRGYHVADAGSARAALQPLMTTYGFEAAERDGTLVFTNRTGQAVTTLGPAQLAYDPERPTAVGLTRAPAHEIAARVQFEFFDADADYEGTVAEIADTQARVLGLSRSSVPLALTQGEGQATVNRWLAETRVGQEGAVFALPPSQRALGAGDVIEVDVDGAAGHFRIDRVDDAGLRLVEATRVDPEVYLPQDVPDIPPSLKPYIGPVPVKLLFLDLPLLRGDEVAHAPHVVASGKPWPGQVAVYSSGTDSDYTLDQVILAQGTIGTLTAPLLRGPVGTWDRQTAVGVKLITGALASFDIQSVLTGSGTLAIGDGTPGNWEVLQYRAAEPTGDRSFALSGFLRGQAGSSAAMPDVWPTGSRVVALNGVPTQIALGASQRGIARFFRYGPATRPYDDPSYRFESATFAGIGLRPYPVVHVRAVRDGSTVTATWIRQTRIDGDDWTGIDVPLGEDAEQYLITITSGGLAIQTDIVATPQWSGTIPAGGKLSVAQISARFGAGPDVTLTVA